MTSYEDSDAPKDEAMSKREESEKIAREAAEISSRVSAAATAAATPNGTSVANASAVNAAVSKDSLSASSVVPSSSSTSVGATTTAAAATTKVPAPQQESRADASDGSAAPPMMKPAAPSTTDTNTVTKKRKLTSPSPPVTVPPPPRAPPVASSSRPMPLINPVIAKTVHDIMGLLQTYGPLSLAQLEYNLPPCNVLQDVLQVMVTLGVVQMVDDSSIHVHHYATKYCIAYGKPRADMLLPQHVVQDILDAQEEITKSQQQSDLLKQALLSPTSNAVEARQLLKSILLANPHVANDPVYMAAFRNLHVDVAGAERERHMQERSSQSPGGKTEREEKTAKETNVNTAQKKQGQSLTAGTKVASNSNGASEPMIPSHAQTNPVPTTLQSIQ